MALIILAMEKYLASAKHGPPSRMTSIVVRLEILGLFLFIWVPVLVMYVAPQEFSMRKSF